MKNPLGNLAEGQKRAGRKGLGDLGVGALGGSLGAVVVPQIERLSESLSGLSDTKVAIFALVVAFGLWLAYRLRIAEED